MIYLKTFLFFNFTEINMLIIFCEKNNIVFYEKFKCGSRNHLILFSISLLCFFFSVILVHNFLTFSFDKEELFNSSISKYVIINANKFLFYTKIIIISMNSISKMTNIEKATIITMLILAFLNLYNFYLQYHYQSQNNFIQKIFYFFSYINLLSCFLLFIGIIIKNKNFNGLIYIFFSVLVVLFIFFYNYPVQEIKINRTFFSFNSDLEIYNQIRLIIDSIHNKNINRRDKINLISYIVEKINIKEKDILYFNFFENITDKEFDFYFFQYIEKILKQVINKFPNSILLLITNVYFNLKIIKRPNKAYILLHKILEEKKLSYSQEFYVYRFKKRIENTGIENFRIRDDISFKYQCNTLIDLIVEICLKYIDFYNLLLSCKEFEDVNYLNKLGNEINFLTEKADYKIKLIEKMKNKNQKILTLYGYFLKEILNDLDKSKKYLDNEIKENEIFDLFELDNNLDINSLIPTSIFQFLIVSMKKDNFGTILRVSLDVCNLLGYSQNILIGQNLSILIPDFLREEHEKNLLKRSKEIEFSFEGNLNNNFSLQPHTFYCKTSSKFLIPVSLLMYYINDENYNPIILCKVNTENNLNNSENIYNTVHILTNSSFNIKYFSSNAIFYMNLSSEITKSNNDITLYVKQFENIKKNKYKDFQKKFLNKEEIINWKKKKFKMTVNELYFFKKLCGLLFHFEDLNLNNNDSKLSKINTENIVSSTLIRVNTSINTSDHKKNSFSFFTINNKINENENIDCNFLPSSKEVNYVIDKREYLFEQKKNTNNKNENNEIDNNKNNFDIIEYLKKKNLLKVKTLTSSSYEKNSTSSEKTSNNFSSSYSSNAESNNHLSSHNDNSNINNKSNFKKITSNEEIENYYKVNFSKIKFKIYNYNDNMFIDIDKFDKNSKVEEIIKQEKIQTKMIIANNNTLNKKISRKKSNKTVKIETPNSEEYDLNKIYEKEKDFIYKKISKSKINIKIIYLIIINIFLICVFMSFPIIYFIQSNSTSNDMKILIDIHLTMLNVLDELYNSFSHGFSLIAIQNPLYSNIIGEKEKLILLFKEKLIDVYYKFTNVSYLIKKNTFKLSKENQERKDNSEIWYWSINDELSINQSYAPILNTLNEYFYCVYCLATTKNNIDLTFTNINFNYIMFNSRQTFIDTVYNFTQIFYDEYKQQTKYNNQINYFLMTIFTTLLLIIIIIYIFIYIKVIQEKEKNLKYFFKIGEDSIKNSLNKCTKYLSLNQEKNNIKYLIRNPKINLDNENESNLDSLYEVNDDEKKLLLNSKLKRKRIKRTKDKKSKYFINDKKSLYFHIFLIIIFYLLINFLCYILLLIMKSKYKNISDYVGIYNLVTRQYHSFVFLYNYMKIYAVYNTYIMTNEYLSDADHDYKQDLAKFFDITLNWKHKIYYNVTNHKLLSKSKKIFETIEHESLCYIMEEYSKEYNFPCEELANNVTNYGFDAICVYYIQNLMYLFDLITNKIQIAIAHQYYYYELLYPSNTYYYIYSQYSMILDDYKEKNPFLVLNDNKTLHLTILNNEVFKPISFKILDTLNEDIKILFDHIEQYLFLTIYIYVIFIIIILLYIPMNSYKNNKEINMTRNMLKIIPQEVLLDIFKEEEKELINKKL